MRSKKGQYTPKEAAIDIMLGWAQAAYNGNTADLDQVDDRESFQVRVKQQLAKEHNRLLRRSGLDGLELDESLPKKME